MEEKEKINIMIILVFFLKILHTFSLKLQAYAIRRLIY